MGETVNIENNDFWVKIVEMLQQNWALIEPMPLGLVCVYFISDASGVFDEITFSSKDEAIVALKRNGFGHYADRRKSQAFLQTPKPPFHRYPHPNGSIYSSGRYWK